MIKHTLSDTGISDLIERETKPPKTYRTARIRTKRSTASKTIFLFPRSTFKRYEKATRISRIATGTVGSSAVMKKRHSIPNSGFAMIR